jgi:hypothetical protein
VPSLALRSWFAPVRDTAIRGLEERRFAADVEVLVLDAEEDIDQGALVHHEVEAAAGIPAVVARGAALGGNRRAADAATIILNSQGGFGPPAFMIGRAIRYKGLATKIPATSPGRETTSTSPSKWTRNNVHI